MSDTPETDPGMPSSQPQLDPVPPPQPEPVNEPGNPQTNEPIVPVSPPELDPSTPRQPDAASRAYKDSMPAVLFDPWLEQYRPSLGGAIQGADLSH